MTPHTTLDIYQTVTDRIMSILEQGTIPWKKQWHDHGQPMNAITKRPYRGINFLFLSCMSYEDPRYLTFKQISEQGGMVKRGEVGHLVIYWKQLAETVNNCDIEALSSRSKMLLRYYKVFNISQCINLPPSLASLSSHTAERTLFPQPTCEAVVLGMKNPPQIIHADSYAYYSPSADLVNMPHIKRFTSDAAYFSTLFHELVHSTGHESRVGRELTTVQHMRSDSYSLEELIAEIGACFLNTYAGIAAQQIENNAAYIQGWLARLRNDKRFIMHASAKAQQAVDYILGVPPQET
ncbi:MAG: ArdC family protein [Candidatus Pacearchaeota archaeon]